MPSWDERRSRLAAEQGRAVADDEQRRLEATLDALDALHGLAVDDPRFIEACLAAAASPNAELRDTVLIGLRGADPQAALASFVEAIATARSQISGPRLATDTAIAEVTLENGVRITVVADPTLSMAAVVHRIDAGAADERPGEAGLAHLVEHALFAPTAEGARFEDLVESVGGVTNAFTSHDTTSWIVRVPPEGLLPVLADQAQRLSVMAPDPVWLEREIAVVDDEVRLRSSLDPRARVAAALGAALLPDHPYGRAIGVLDAGASPAAFHARTYVAERLQVVVVSPIDPDTVVDAISEAYATFPRGEAPEPAPAVALASGPIRVEGPEGAGEVGLAWALPPSRPCPDEPTAAPCTATPWVDMVVLALFTQAGVHELEFQLSRSVGGYASVEVRTFDGASGGWVAVTARRFPTGRQVATNLAGVLTGRPFMSNPSARGLWRVLADDSGDWISDEAIESARQAVLRSELARAYSAADRAQAVSARTAVGLAPTASAARGLRTVESSAVTERYHEIFHREPVFVRVR